MKKACCDDCWRKPHFIKVLIDHDFHERLRMPPAFVRKHMVTQRHGGDALLRCRKVRTWKVKLCASEDGLLVFEDGWAKFAKHYKLQLGEFLLFRFFGDLRFKVVILGTQGVERRKSTTGYCTPTISKESEDRIPQEDSDTNVEDHETSTSSGNLTKMRRKCCLPKHRKGPTVVKREGSSSFSKSASASKSKDPLLKKKRNLGSFHTAAEAGFDNLGRGLLGNISSMRGAIFQSQRRAISLEERERALHAAQSYKPKNSHFLVVMAKTHVYQIFELSIPKWFVKEAAFDPTRSFVIIHGPNDKSFPLKYSVSRITGLGRFYCGWGEFSVENNLEEGDVCVFETLSRKLNELKATIFRVVNEITPLFPYVLPLQKRKQQGNK